MAVPSRKRSVKSRAQSTSETRRKRPAGEDVKTALDWLRANATKAVREGMARYAIPSERAFGVSVNIFSANGASHTSLGQRPRK